MSSIVCPSYVASGYCSWGDNCRYAHVDMADGTRHIDYAPDKPKKSKKPKSHKASKKSKKLLSASAGRFTAFFDEYPEFYYNPMNSVTVEFFRMCNFFGWDKMHPERQVAHEALKDVMVKAFNEKYGTDENDIESWYRLCRVLQIDPIPDNLEECRSAVLAVHVNLVDLVDNGYKHARIFPNLKALQAYTRKGRYFPKENAYAGGLLRYLLREIDSKYKGNPTRTRMEDVRGTIDRVFNKRRG